MGRIIEYEEKDITPIPGKMGRPVRKQINVAATKINTRLVTPKLLGPFRKVCVMRKAAEIHAKIIPLEIYDLKFYVLQGRLEGKIRFKVKNESSEGSKAGMPYRNH